MYRLGIDMGTNSIGWCLWKLEEKEDAKVPTRIIDIGVRVFSDGRVAKTGAPLAVQRRDARSARRRRDRSLERKRKLVRTLVDSGYLSKDPEVRRKLSETEGLKDPYFLRDKAIKEPLSKDELSRVLINLVQRRGFKSNRKDVVKDEKEVAGIKAGIRGLWELIQDRGFKTLGQLLASNKLPSKRFRPGNSEAFPERAMYEKEFDVIREVQSRHHPDLPWDRIRHIIYFQNPLKPVEVGRCTFYTDEPRGWKALPSAQRFRYLQFLLNLRKINERNESLPLTNDEVDLAIDLFEKRQSVTLTQLREYLGLNDATTFNYGASKGNSASGETQEPKFKGNETMVRLSKSKAKKFFEVFIRLSEEEQDTVVTQMIEATEDSDLVEYLEERFPNLSETELKTVLAVRLPEGTMSVSARFMRDCNNLMQKQKLAYHEATKRLVGDHRLPPIDNLRDNLPYYGEVLPESVVGAKPDDPNASVNPEVRYGKIQNPTVHIALNQLRKLANVIISKHGRPEQIVLELSRDLPRGQKARAESDSIRSKNEKANEKIRIELNRMYGQPDETPRSRDDIKRHKLWEELKSHPCCVYCGKPISATEYLSHEVEVEHILPFSRTLFDGITNLTLSHASCNRAKGNKSPFEAFGHSPGSFDWNDIVNRSKELPENKRRLFSPDAMERFEKDSGFITRQLTDNQYLSRIARRYLSFICAENNIWTVNGRLTADLRHAWGLDFILSRRLNQEQREALRKNKTKSRADHRHHAMDALVIGLIDRRTVQLAANANKGKGLRGFQAPFPFPIHRNEIEDIFAKIVTSHKPDHGLGGGLLRDTAYGKIKVLKKVPISEVMKRNFDTSRIVSDKIRGMVEEGTVADQGLDNITIVTDQWASRVPIERLEKKKHIESIVSEEIRLELLAATEGIPEGSQEWKKAVSNWAQRIPKDPIMTVEDIENLIPVGFRHQLLKELKNVEPGSHEWEEAIGRLRQRARVRAVRCSKTSKFVELPRKGQDRFYKAYETDDFLLVDIWFIPEHRNQAGKKQKAKYEGTYLSRFEANQQLGTNKDLKYGRPLTEKPHPAAKHICQLFKHDILVLDRLNDLTTEASETVVTRVAGFSAQDQRIDIAPVNAANSIDEWIKLTAPRLVNAQWKPAKGQNYISINVIFGRLGGRKAIISIDSKLLSR